MPIKQWLSPQYFKTKIMEENRLFCNIYMCSSFEEDKKGRRGSGNGRGVVTGRAGALVSQQQTAVAWTCQLVFQKPNVRGMINGRIASWLPQSEPRSFKPMVTFCRGCCCCCCCCCRQREAQRNNCRLRSQQRESHVQSPTVTFYNHKMSHLFNIQAVFRE